MDVWPNMTDPGTGYCAALFIDVRGSSKMAAKEHGTEAPTVALRTRQLIEETKRLWADGPIPSSVRSIGDGLFCVWIIDDADHVAAQATRTALLEQVLLLSEDLPGVLTKKWRAPVELGMGLACGAAATAVVAHGKDYYGYVINLAAKLQDLARPSGVVILDSFVNVDPAIWKSQPPSPVEVTFPTVIDPADKGAVPTPAERRTVKLYPREYDLPFAKSDELRCLVTPHVDEVHNWTCLAWPGFAISRDGDVRRLGLNTRGITVLTHQGLKGNIGTLRIWPRNDARKTEGDRFELIIDDYDSLAQVNEAEPGFLYEKKYQGNLTTHALSQSTGKQFFFVPIRSGLNALAWHKKYGAAAAGHETYRDTIDAAAAGTMAVGLYDNVGATMPLLIDGLTDTELHDVFKADKKVMEQLIERLRALSDGIGSRKLFTVYSDIVQLAGDLRAGEVHAVLGGGAWLASNAAAAQNVESGIPSKARGFLWVEGAAVVAHIDEKQIGKIREFLDATVLDADYQRELMRGSPYGSCPVNSALVTKILTDEGSFRATLAEAEKAIFDETLQIYDEGSPDSFSRQKQIKLRKLPDHAELWQVTWQQIKQEFCVSDTD